MWEVETTHDFDQWLPGELADEERIEVIARVELLKVLGPRLSRPHADTLKGSRHANLKELRGRTSRSVLRIAFAFDQDRSAILPVGGNKQGVNEKRFYRALIDRADELLDQHLRRRKR